MGADEERIVSALKKLGGRDYTKNVANKAEMSLQTASKYLSILEARNIVKKDTSLRPHIYWELKGEK